GQVTSVDLRGNELYRLGAAGLDTAFSSLPGQVTSVDLRGNKLYRLGTVGLATVLSSLPNHVTSVDLGWNYLNELGATGLATVLSGLPNHVTSVDLLGNNLHCIPSGELDGLLAGLPSHIKYIGLQDNHLFPSTLKEADTRLTALTEASQGRFLNLSFNGLSLVNCILPVFLTAYRQKGWHSKNGWWLASDVIGNILEYLLPMPLLGAASENGMLSYLAIRNVGHTLSSMPDYDILSYLRTKPSEGGLRVVKKQFMEISKNIADPDVRAKLLASMDLCFEITKIEKASLKMVDQSCGMNVRATLGKMRESTLIFLSPNRNDVDRAQAKAVFNQTLNELKPMLSKIYPVTWKSVLATLMIAATVVGLIALAVHYQRTGLFFVRAPDYYRASNMIERAVGIQAHP
ncbi:MAG: hypothetical protein Q8L68_02115, partial [Methylococcales bacterium]|nr:hypothetical protein [Methylococcales bacterium]